MIEREVNNVHSLSNVAKKLVGQVVKRPLGTMAGHASGLPFEELVHKQLLRDFAGRVFRQHEQLNTLFLANPDCTTTEERKSLLGPTALAILLTRGVEATKNWSPSSQFSAKQDDTAESVLLPTQQLSLSPKIGKPIHLIDVKSHDVNKQAQPPNIISARKLVSVCATLLSEGATDVPLTISYIAVQWKADKTTLECTESRAISLFHIPPKDLYINWASAMQLQFHPMTVDQSYTGTPLEWVTSFVSTYRDQLEKRVLKQSTEVTALTKLLSSGKKLI